MAKQIDYVKVKVAAERLVWLITDLSYKAPEVRPDHDDEIVACASTIADEAGVSKLIATILLTPEEVETEFKIARSTQAAMRSRRQIPFILIGPRMPRYRRSDLLAWLAERVVAVDSSGARR